MDSPFKDYINFEINGITPFLSDEDKKVLRPLVRDYNKVKKVIDTVGSDRTPYTIDLYSLETKVKIFNLKDRKSKEIMFKNSKDVLCVIHD